MKLLFVGTNRGGGGTESHFITLALALAAAGHEVTAAVWPDEFIHRALAADGRVRLAAVRFTRRNDWRAAREVARLVRERRPDWLVGTFKREYWPLAAVSRLMGVPLVLFSHLDQRMQPLMARGLPRIARRIVAPSEYQRRRLIARGMPASRVETLYNPLDTTRFRPDAALRSATRAALGFSPDDVVAAFVGRQERGKGVMVLAESLERAMNEEPRLRMLWVGHAGDEATAVRETIAASRHAARHVWAPWAADVVPYMNAADLVALPSIGPETFGLVLAEGQACGVPALGSRAGGIPETMDEGVTGLLLPPGDVEAWSDALLRLARDDGLRARMGAAGREFVVQHFEAGRIAAEFVRRLGGWR